MYYNRKSDVNIPKDVLSFNKHWGARSSLPNSSTEKTICVYWNVKGRQSLETVNRNGWFSSVNPRFSYRIYHGRGNEN